MGAHRYARHLRWLATIIVASVPVIVAFNYFMDPYGIWNAPEVGWLNAAKPAETDNELMFKAADVRRHRPVTLLLGSSRVGFALDPRHPALAQQGPAYNLSLLGGYIDPILQVYQHALRNHPPATHVIMGLDFFAFNRNAPVPASFDSSRLGRDDITLRDIVSSLLTRDAVIDSFRTAMATLKTPQFRAFTQGMSSDALVRQYEAEHGTPKRFAMSTELYINHRSRYNNLVLSEEAFADFAKIVQLSRDRGIELQLFVHPEHVVLLEAMRVRNVWDTYWTWKRRIAEIAPFWDFSGYNPITTAPIERGMTLYWDPSHFRKGVGDLVLDRMLGVDNPDLPPDFGRQVTSANLQQWRAENERAREKWAADHGDVVQWVRQLAVDR